MGYHIARNYLMAEKKSFKAKFLGESGKFVTGGESLLFLDHNDAHDYAKKIGIEIGDLTNAIIECDCPEFFKNKHPIVSSDL